MSISTVTSEALQLKLRQLLPSQQGFGTDLSASDTIIPIIDLTQAAEGSDVPEYLQRAMAFGSQTQINCQNNTVTLANSPGFYGLSGVSTLVSQAFLISVDIQVTDGATTKTFWRHEAISATAGAAITSLDVNLVFFLTAGETAQVISNTSAANLIGSIRQLADSNGTLVQPSGFNPQ